MLEQTRDVNSREIAFPGRESQFPGLDRDSRFRPSTYFYLCDRSWIAGGGREGGAITGWTQRRSRPMTGPHRRLRTINIVGSGAPKTAGGSVRGARDRGSAIAIGPQTTGRGITALPVGRRWRSTSRAGWARETAGSGQVFGTVAHLSKHRRAARWRDTIADRMPGMGDHRPAVGHGWTIGRHCGRLAHLMSALTRLWTVIFIVSYIEADW